MIAPPPSNGSSKKHSRRRSQLRRKSLEPGSTPQAATPIDNIVIPKGETTEEMDIFFSQGAFPTTTTPTPEQGNDSKIASRTPSSSTLTPHSPISGPHTPLSSKSPITSPITMASRRLANVSESDTEPPTQEELQLQRDEISTPAEQAYISTPASRQYRASFTKNRPPEARARGSFLMMKHPRSEVPTFMIVDALHYAKEGVSLLKHCGHGSPHFRHFHISNDHSKLIWYSSGKKLTETTIPLKNVAEIIEGQKTPNFKRNSSVFLSTLSFSLRYTVQLKRSSKQKYLDTIASEQVDFDIWFSAIKELVRVCDEGKNPSEIKSIPVEVRTDDAIRCTMFDLRDINGMSAADHGAVPPKEFRNNPGKHISLAEVAESFSSVKQWFTKVRKMLASHPYQECEVYNTILTKMRGIDQLIKEAQERFDESDYIKCDHLVWKTNIQLTTLDNMLQAIKHEL